MEDKCASLELEKKKLYDDLTKSRQSFSGDNSNFKFQNEKLKSENQQVINKSNMQILQLRKCKEGLLSEIEQLIIRHK